MELTARQAAISALDAYLAGTLSAQAPRPAGVYETEQDGKTYHCAIGAALSQETLDKITAQETGNYVRISTLIAAGIITSPDERELTNLQRLHDGWVLSQDPAGFLSYAWELVA